ncbi:MAG: hypothetical protein HUU20_17505 [Pirellulales bacterium]|nr:hypothetical protein [Pirellulales bacterium]
MQPLRQFAILALAVINPVAVAPAARAVAAEVAPPQTQVVAACDFEGPYTAGDQQIQEGCGNNWQWGRKDMQVTADKNAGRPGAAQRIQVRGIASGGMQFFYTRLALKKNHYYRISYWLKGDGLEGPVRCYVRKIGHPWTVYVWADFKPWTAQWQQYSFTGRCAEDVPDDVGVCWEHGSVGTIWLDDLKVEQSTSPLPGEPAKTVNLPTSGNLLPRSSFEGRSDHHWSTMFFGWSRNGVWEGVESDWEDPQHYRAEGGKVGRYCMAVPSAAHAGQAGTLSLIYDLLPGRPYTVSLWMKSDPPGFPSSASLVYYWSGRHLQSLKNGAVYPKLTSEWQRVSFATTPEAPPDAKDTTAPVQVMLQISPSAVQKGTVYADGLQLEPGDKANDYRPAYPLELYADVGQDGGNLLDWDQAVPLNLLAAAADTTPMKEAAVEVTIVGYPDVIVWRKTLTLPVGREHRFDLDLKRRGLIRVEMRTKDPSLAAPQEMIMALVPKPRGTGVRGMFGTHIALRPELVRYVSRLGFTWTRLHDCSLLTKWSATEPKPGQFVWHDAVVDGVRQGGLNILGLPDHEPEWARVGAEGANPVDVAAFGRYCEELARHYAGKIDHWEVWNEPYMGGFYTGGAQRFGDVLKAGAAGLKRGNPDCKVIGWCADVGNPRWGEGIAEDARRGIDIFSFHHYINNLSGGGTLPFAAELADHRKLWPAHVSECWNTEGTNGALCGNGFYTHLSLATPDTNARATAFASRVWIEHAKAGVSKFFPYQMHNADTLMYYGGYQSLLIHYDRTPTPAAVAAAVTAYSIDGLKCLPCPPVEGVVQGLFEGQGRATWAVFDDGAVTGRKHLSLEAIPSTLTVLDVMGNDPRRDGVKQWEIGIQPLFVLAEKKTGTELAAAMQAAVR